MNKYIVNFDDIKDKFTYFSSYLSTYLLSFYRRKQTISDGLWVFGDSGLSVSFLVIIEPASLLQNERMYAKVVMEDIEIYEQTQETIALLKILALGTRQIEEGKIQPAGDVVERLQDRSKTS